MKYLLFILIMLVGNQVSAQSDKINKWKISLGSGFAIPFTEYGKVDVQNSISIRDNNIQVYEFFDKENHGAAQIGYFFSLSAGRQIFRHFLVSFNFDYAKNSVKTIEINNYYDETMNIPYYHVFSQNDYKVRGLYLSIGYQWRKNHWMANIQPLLGWYVMSFPSYKLQMFRDESFGDQAHTVAVDWLHRTVISDPQSLSYGISATVTVLFFKSLFLEVHSKFMSADFDYVIVPKTPGVDPRTRSDVVNYRIIDLGLSVGVAF